LRLDIGCGQAKREGFIGVDLYAGSTADVLADIEKGLPFKDNIFSEIWMHHVFEHLGNPIDGMKEVWRVCRDEALVEITGPYFSSPHFVWRDPTHRRPLSLRAFYYFDGSWYGKKWRIRVERGSLKKSNTSFRHAGWKFWYWPFIIPNKVIEYIVNLSLIWIDRFERLASRFISFDELRVVLIACKD
jgi:SAM-dependent methyltransferase